MIPFHPFIHVSAYVDLLLQLPVLLQDIVLLLYFHVDFLKQTLFIICTIALTARVVSTVGAFHWFRQGGLESASSKLIAGADGEES